MKVVTKESKLCPSTPQLQKDDIIEKKKKTKKKGKKILSCLHKQSSTTM
jgi:hypothetical protein